MIANALRRAADISTSKHGITGAQSFVLSYLSRHRDPYPCQHDIEVRFNIKHPTATGILRRLSEKGFVEFRPDEYDKRLKRVVITDAGIDAVEHTRSSLDEAEAFLTSSLTPDETVELNRLLDKLVEKAKLTHRESHMSPDSGEGNSDE
jgi:DNA-binding MarR family transcriptional regulator